MKAILPWVDLLLVSVRNEFRMQSPKFTVQEPTDQNLHHIQTILKNPSGFDSDSLIRDTLANHNVRQATSGPHTILCVCENLPDLSLWFRILRLFANNSPARVTYFGHPSKRTPPSKGEPIEPIHINGGYANQCSLESIVIYREEDAARVLIHELFHASCSDPEGLAIPYLEADTEAWAEIVYCAVKAKGVRSTWEQCMQEQIQYAVQQAEYAKQNHNVTDTSDYSWRYLTGRLNVWTSLGFQIQTNQPPKMQASLRLTKDDLTK